MRLTARAAAIALIPLFACIAAADDAFTVRPISDAERSAVEHAAAYLTGGPQALLERLAPASPLRRVPAADALQEIETRLGPPGGATWELQTVVPALKDRAAAFSISFPSGVDETAVFDLVRDGSSYKVDDIRILAMPSRTPPAFSQPAEGGKATVASVADDDLALALGLLCAAAAAAGALLRRVSARVAHALVALSAILLLSALAVAVLRTGRARVARTAPPAPAALSAAGAYPRLAPLLELRRSLASGAEITTIVRGSEHGVLCRDVSQLWRAQLDLQQMRTADAKRILDRFDSPSTVPLVEILRGRIAISEQDDAAAALAYEHAVSLGPGRDGLWSETAHALLSLGYDERAERYLSRLARIGSRDADVYYVLAMLAASKNKDEDAEKLLRQAWELRPAPRSELIAAGPLWSTIRRPAITTLIPLGTPDEATVVSPAACTRPIALPQSAAASVSGDYLDVRIGEQELAVPGGACLAPNGTPLVDAGTWQASEEKRGLDDFARVSAVSGTAGAYTQPALRRRILRSAVALATRNRWTDVVKLTDGLSARAEHVPPMLLFLRAAALKRVDRVGEAKQLLADLAVSRVLQRRRDARALADLGEMLASFDMHDAAVKMFEKAQSIRPSERVENRITQVQMDQHLATRYQTWRSPHFEVHFPQDSKPQDAQFISRVLEDELKRLQAWVPVAEFQPVVVNLVPWQEFRSLAGNDYTLGLYHGKITVPLAGIVAYPPPIVSILTHELCHAMIAQATHDQAPRWFHEGLASRVEMIGLSRNAFNMYDDPKLLALTLLDPVLDASPDPEMIGEGYLVSTAAIRYIEARYGRNALAKMTERFRDGATTDDVLASLSGRSVAEFDREFRQWGRAEQRVFETPVTVRYDTDDQLQITRSGAPANAPRPAAAAVPQPSAPLGRGSLGGGTFYPTGKKP